jgi:YesN/AraC family two-component response regulator
MGNGRRIRVLIVDDHDLFREGLRQLIETDPAIEVVGEAANGQDALKMVAELQPDVVLMDINMPGMDGSVRRRRSSNIPTCSCPHADDVR